MRVCCSVVDAGALAGPERLIENVGGPALEVFLEAQLARERVALRREAVLVVQRGVGAALVIDVARVPVGADCSSANAVSSV